MFRNLFFAVAVVVTLNLGCDKTPVVVESVSIEQSERDSLISALKQLDETLKTHSPFVANELALPASDVELEGINTQLGGATRPRLEIWFGWHNGSKGKLTNLLPLGGAISIEESMEDRRAMQSVPFVNHNRRRDVKILDDGCGDGFFLDLAKSPPRVYYEMLEDPFPRDYGTLLEFVTFIDRVHVAGIASVNDVGNVVFEYDAYDQIRDEHFSSLEPQGSAE